LNKIKLSKASISEIEKEAVLRVLDKEFLGMGEEVKLFEEKIKDYLNTSMEVVCVNTGTSALHLALSALDLKKGDEVLVPSLTYVASFQAISAIGATAIACEINPSTLFISITDLEKKISKKSRVIMPVHYASNSSNMDEVYKLAKKYKLRVVEDAAQAFGSKRRGELIGTHGDIICFSFDGIKNITSGEGGAILSSDQGFIQRAQDGRLLGVEKDTDKRFSGIRSWSFNVNRQGYRYHMSNIMAAIGIVQIDRIDSFKSKRQQIARTYIKELKDVQEIEFLDFNFDEILPHIFVIKTKNRNKLKEFLTCNSIECGVHYMPNHLLSKYKTNYKLFVTEEVCADILSLPCHYDLSVEEQGVVIEKIKEFYGG
jgi:dTDP-4-amino-4,6-dideoxygalactose transaminase